MIRPTPPTPRPNACFSSNYHSVALMKARVGRDRPRMATSRRTARDRSLAAGCTVLSRSTGLVVFGRWAAAPLPGQELAVAVFVVGVQIREGPELAVDAGGYGEALAVEDPVAGGGGYQLAEGGFDFGAQ